MDTKLIIRIFTLLFTLVNLVLTSFKVNPVPIADDVAYQIISIVVTIGAVIWNAWKNNNFTPAAKAGQKVIDGIKEGKITAETVEEFLK